MLLLDLVPQAPKGGFDFFDLLDGGIARATNRVSKRGALMDSVFDRVSELALLIGLAMYYVTGPDASETAVLG